MKDRIRRTADKLLKISRFTALIVGVLSVAVIIAAGYFAATLSDQESSGEDKTALNVENNTVGDSVLLNPTDDGHDNNELEANSTALPVPTTVPSTSSDEEMGTPVSMTVRADGTSYAIVTFADTVAEALRENNISADTNDLITGADLTDEPQNGMTIVVVRIDEDQVSETEILDYEIIYRHDKTLMDGQTQVLTEGKKGSVVRTYSVVREDGQIVTKTLIDTQRTEPVDKVILYGATNSITNSRGERVDYSKKIDMVATAYLADSRWGNHTYFGPIVRLGVISVDPSVIPLGTKVYVASDSPYGDYGFAVAWDIGSAIKGNIIDLYMESYDLTMNWGRRSVTVYILEDQSIDVFALRRDGEVFVK